MCYLYRIQCIVQFIIVYYSTAAHTTVSIYQTLCVSNNMIEQMIFCLLSECLNCWEQTVLAAAPVCGHQRARRLFILPADFKKSFFLSCSSTFQKSFMIDLACFIFHSSQKRMKRSARVENKCFCGGNWSFVVSPQ